MANKRPIMRWIEIIFLHFKLSVTVKEEYHNCILLLCGKDTSNSE